jgi:hypothetical protein
VLNIPFLPVAPQSSLLFAPSSQGSECIDQDSYPLAAIGLGQWDTSRTWADEEALRGVLHPST